MSSTNSFSKLIVAMFLSCALVAFVFTGQTLAGGKGNKGGGDDIILYNGNIVLRGNGGGKGKGKGGGGSIVVANSNSHGHGHGNVEMLPMFGGWGEGFGMRRR